MSTLDSEGTLSAAVLRFLWSASSRCRQNRGWTRTVWMGHISLRTNASHRVHSLLLFIYEGGWGWGWGGPVAQQCVMAGAQLASALLAEVEQLV